MKKILLILIFLGFCTLSFSKSINVTQYGIYPNSYENITVNLQKILVQCKADDIDTLILNPGRYDIWPENSVRKEFYISNTSSEEEYPSKIKTIGVYIDDFSDFTIQGNGATLIFHGFMTPVAINNSRNIKIRNLHIDYERPGGSECTVENIGENYIDVKFHRDSKWDITLNGKINLYGEGWKSRYIYCAEYHPENAYYHASSFWNTVKDSTAIDLGDNRVRFMAKYDKTKPGHIFTMRDIIRREVGFFINESENVILDSLFVHSMLGFGMVAQRSVNITMQSVRCAPKEGSGRVMASSADFMHFSGCKGFVKVLDCSYSGANDDCINIHGTNLRAVETLGDNTLKVRFMHPQSYGFKVYSEGDSVAFVKAASMLRIGYAKVVSFRRVNQYEIELKLDRNIPKEFKVGEDCIENYTWTPSAEIKRNYFTGITTRGMLVTTPRKVVISDNSFVKTPMAAILIEGDARGWYESGPVKDVLIENNKFLDCSWLGGPAIVITPSTSIVDPKKPVNSNVRIIGNYFELNGRAMIKVKSTSGLIIKDNTLISPSENPIILEACPKVDVQKLQ